MEELANPTKRHKIRRKLAGLSAWFAFALLASSTARANGRFPRSERLLESPGNSNQLLLAATYGLLTTSNRGGTWSYVCEKAFALQDNYIGDPIVAWMGNGALLAGVQSTLNSSQDQACNWNPVLGGQLGQLLVDYSVSASDPKTVVALTSRFQAGAWIHRLSLSSDYGATWLEAGDPLPLALAYTVDIDPNDPTHILATGIDSTQQGVLVSSTAQGTGWVSHDIPNTNSNEPPYLAALDPKDSKKIYVRTDAWPEIDGNLVGNDALIVTTDGGITWNEVIRQQAKLLGFALSPSGEKLLLGYGDPKLDPYVVDDTVMGIYASRTNSFDFAKIYDGAVTCLSWTASGAYACTSQALTSSAVGFNADPDAMIDSGAASFSSLLDLTRVSGPLGCCGGSAAAVCAAPWATACTIFGACGNTAEACSGDAGSILHPADSGVPLDASAAAGGTSSGAAGTATGGGAVTTGNAHSSGCGCRTASPRHPWLTALALSFATLLAATRRRRETNHS